MSSYNQVSEALDRGVDPQMICETCPWDRLWDRLCITPPTMTRAEVKAKVEPPEKFGADANKEIMTGLISVLAYAGKDQTSQICPVLAVRLRSQDGRSINDAIRSLMVPAAAVVPAEGSVSA